MLEYELMYFFFGAPIWNLSVIIGSIVGFSKAGKGKSPIGAFLVGILIFCIPVWGDYLLNKRQNTGYFFSEEVIISIVFLVIYLCITMPLAIKKYHKKIYEKVYFCASCGAEFKGDVREEPQAHYRCPKCGAPLINISFSSNNREETTDSEKEKHQFVSGVETDAANEVIPDAKEKAIATSDPVDQMLCGNCGSVLAKGAKFCEMCGAPVKTVEAERPSSTEARCRNCGSVLAKGAKFCKMCGAPVKTVEVVRPSDAEARCRNCGSVLAKDAKFCEMCGTPVTAAEVTEEEV